MIEFEVVSEFNGPRNQVSESNSRIRVVAEIDLFLRSPKTISELDAAARNAMQYADLESAIAIWKRARAWFPNDPKPYIEEIEVLALSGRYGEAEDLATEALQRFPNYFWVARAMVSLISRRDGVGRSISEWQKLREDFPAEPSAQIGLAQALRECGEYDEAERVAYKAIELAPDFVWAADVYATVATDRENWSEAAKRWKIVRQRFPDHLRGYLEEIKLLAKLGNLESADVVAADACTRFSENESTYRQYARLASDRKDWPEAKMRWQTAVQRFPQSKEAVVEFARVLIESGQNLDAEELLSASISKFGEHVDILFLWAECASLREDWVEAHSRWVKLLAIPGDQVRGVATIKLADTLAMLGRMDDVEVLYRTTFADRSWDFGLQIELLTTLLDTGKIGPAIEILTKINEPSAALSKRFYQVLSRAAVHGSHLPNADRVLLKALQEPSQPKYDWLPEILGILANALIHHVSAFEKTVKNLKKLDRGEVSRAKAERVFEMVMLFVHPSSFERGFIKDRIKRYINEGQARVLMAISMDADHGYGRDFSSFGVRGAVFNVVDEMLASTDLTNLNAAGILTLLALAYRGGFGKYATVLHNFLFHPEAIPKIHENASEYLRKIFVRDCFQKACRRSPQRSTRPLHIALCVSGQLRGYREAYSSWRHLGLGNHKVRIYLHVWKNIGRKSPTTASALGTSSNFIRVYSRIVQEVHAKRLRTWYPSLYSPGFVSIAELEEFYHTPHIVIEDDYTERFKNMDNPTKMYYKIQAAHQLAVTDNANFDLIIRMRGDKQILPSSAPNWHAIHRQSVTKGQIFADRGRFNDGMFNILVGDQFAVGTPEVMDIYASSYEFYVDSRKQERPLFSDNYRAHETMALTCFYNGIDVQKAPSIDFGRLLEAPPPTPKDLLEMLRTDIGKSPRNVVDEELLAACFKDVMLGSTADG